MHPQGDFAQLRIQVHKAGLLRPQPLYYTAQVLWCLSILAIALVVPFLTKNIWLVLLDAVFFAFVSGQIGLLGHDAGHCQIFRGRRWNMFLSRMCVLGTGVSSTYWIGKHNEHHAHPNEEESDPDIEYIVLAFTEKQARSARGLVRFIVQRQSQLFFPLIGLSAYSLRDWSIRCFFRSPLRKIWIDLLCFLSYFILYFSWIFTREPVGVAMAFIVVHQAVWGMYMGSVFAPNHKGMPVIEKGQDVDYLRQQVVTARNVRGNLLVDLLYGGLNYQIEHHLFPVMPRCNLRKAKVLVQKYCQSVSVPYHETGVLQSYREIRAFLREMSEHAQSLPELRQTALSSLAAVRRELSELTARVLPEEIVSVSQWKNFEALQQEAMRRVDAMCVAVERSRNLKRQKFLWYQQEAQKRLEECKAKWAQIRRESAMA